MKADRFELVRQLLLEVSDLPKGERDAYLAEACKDDPDLYVKVTSLLAREGKEPGILKTGAVAPTAPGDSLVGETVSHFKILGQLGVGGMGVVYKAEDTTLKRTVALKFLPPELARDPAAKARFLREAQAAAALDHTNICTVYETGESEGLTFIAMACVEGRSLKEMLEAGPLELDQTMDLSVQIAEGLKVAHDKGIVHRDIKPANVMVTSEGRAKIADFGLAKFSGRSDITTGGTRMGTVSYMSPEQARGDPVDHRTDIWSLGAMLYQMVTGQRPFRGDHDSAVIYSILNEEPKPMTSVREGVPQEVQWIVDRAMAKASDDRYQTAAAMLADLGSFRRGFDEGAGRTRIVAAKPRPSIAVLPFANMSGDPEDEYFGEGLAEDLINALSRISDLRVVARTSAFSFKGKDVAIRDIGRRLRVETLLEGSVRRSGSRLRVSVQLVNAADGRHLWSDRYNRQIEDVFAVQDEISLGIVDKLEVQLLGKKEPKVTRRPAGNQEAYDLHLKGRHYYHRLQLDKALACYQQSIAADPNYGPPYAGLALILSHLVFNGQVPPGETFRKARAMAHEALQRDRTLADAYGALATANLMHDYEWSEAERQFRKGIELDPSNTGVRVWYSSLLWAIGRSDEAREQVEVSRELDPLAVAPHCFLANAFLWERQYEKAIEYFRTALEMDPRYALAGLWLAETFIAAGRYQDAIETCTGMVEWPGCAANALWRLGVAYARAGETARALEAIDRLEKDAKSRGMDVQPLHLTIIYLGLGRDELGFEHLERAYADRDPLMPWLRHPAFDPYQSDPRFNAVLRKMKLADVGAGSPSASDE